MSGIVIQTTNDKENKEIKPPQFYYKIEAL